MKKGNFLLEVINQIAKERGIVVQNEERYGHCAKLIFPSGRQVFLSGTLLDINSAAATAVANDKDYTNYFLQKDGWPVVEGRAFFSENWGKTIGIRDNGVFEAIEYANKLGCPLIVKPNGLCKGIGISLVSREADLEKAIRYALKFDKIFLVQRYVEGRDFRVVVYQGEVLAAYERRPFGIVGTGSDSVGELIDQKNADLLARGREAVSKGDRRVKEMLNSRGIAFGSVLLRGEKINLLPNANLSAGGEALDVSDCIAEEWGRIFAKVSKSTALNFVGIDVISKNSLEETPGEFKILEVNAAPGLANYATVGETQRERVAGIYRRILSDLF